VDRRGRNTVLFNCLDHSAGRLAARLAASARAPAHFGLPMAPAKTGAMKKICALPLSGANLRLSLQVIRRSS